MKIPELAGTKRQKTQTRAIIFRVTEPTWELLSKMAEDNGTTVSAVIRWLLDRGLRAISGPVYEDGGTRYRACTCCASGFANNLSGAGDCSCECHAAKSVRKDV